MKILREPLLHFLFLGAVIFLVSAAREGQRPREDAAKAINITADTIAWLRDGYSKQWHRAPDADELRGLVHDHLREEVLYREALAMGLDQNDSIVRRRMAQKMDFLTQDIAAAVEADEATQREYFKQNASRYSKAARVSFRHVFFSNERRGTKLEADSAAALVALTDGANEETLGDPFLGEHELSDATPDDIAAAFGRDFAEQVIMMPTGQWKGPVISSYGVHHVMVSGRAEPQAVPFEAVRDAVARDLSEERRRAANEDLIERLKAQYQITIDETVLSNPATPSTRTATR
jgi:peptidyl-prolyl cis-trans isomerase C